MEGKSADYVLFHDPLEPSEKIVNITKIEENVSNLLSKFSKDTFIFDLLLAYGQPKSAITRLKQGTYNLSKEDNEVLWKKKIFFKAIKKGDLHDIIDDAKNDPSIKKQDPRFLIITDYKTLLAIDSKTGANLDIEIDRLTKHFDFFLPLGGFEKVEVQIENPADVKAAEKMAKLYDQIKTDNPGIKEKELHDLNVFLSRLLFCYFAEDTEIFEKGAFTSSVASHTSPDGTDLSEYLDRLFDALNTKDRKKLPAYLQKFPYVNGGLLSNKIKAPAFSAKSRKILLECGELNWSAINPDIFGSMIQAVVHPDQRGGMGMHYTSVPNIMKVLKPLFLDNFYLELEQNYSTPTKLHELLNRMEQIKFFDPACGSGNFLIIAYKELRSLEIKILKRLSELSLLARNNDKKLADLSKVQINFLQSYQDTFISRISLHNFYGIEIDDFAHEVAMLSLWLAEHQMNLSFKEHFGKVQPTLPLKQGGQITCGNANELNWETICSPLKNNEVYIFGNPPYLGARNQSTVQKKELQSLLSKFDGVNSLDYIAAWFYSAAKYIAKNTNTRAAFVSTNSITQGEQVSLFWPNILELGVEIEFAYQSFKWSNMAKKAAVVTCVIIGLRKISDKPKYIYSDQSKQNVKNISPYLTSNENVFVFKRSKPLGAFDELVFGNQSIDGGHLILTPEEKEQLLEESAEAEKYLRPLYSAEDFIDGKNRWCIWVNSSNYKDAKKIAPLNRRFLAVKKYRENGGEVARSLVEIPYRFRYVHEAKNSILILPRTTTENRNYLAVGFLDSQCIVTDAAQVIYDPQIHIFGILSSKMHMTWVKAVAGRLKTDIRYSNQLCYNNFPFPEITQQDKQSIENCVREILSQREAHSDKTIGDLYAPEEMPIDLLKAHQALDTVVDRCFRSRPFSSDEERLSFLFEKYKKLVEDNQDA